VDISRASVEVARSRSVYDEVLHADFNTSLREASLYSSQDVVLLADAVPYMGPLEELIGLISSVVRPGGLVVLNADVPVGGNDEGPPSTCGAGAEGYSLEFTGRWAHCPAYVHRTAAAAGLRSLKTETIAAQHMYRRSGSTGLPVRTDRAQIQKSMLFVLQRPAPIA
jgi:predicted TPR repeat methyltransferase